MSKIYNSLTDANDDLGPCPKSPDKIHLWHVNYQLDYGPDAVPCTCKFCAKLIRLRHSRTHYTPTPP